MEVPFFTDRILSCLKAPGGGDDTHISLSEPCLVCSETDEKFPFDRGLPSLFRRAEGDNAAIVRPFYEEYPFPNYDGVEEQSLLVNKGYSSPFARSLLKAIGYNKLVLECGCGTGQMTHFLALNNNHVLGVDMSLTSLSLAFEHKLRNRLVRSCFAQMNIFDLAVKDQSFDVVICHGVLPTIPDAERAFRHLVKKVKPGGIIIVGLYNFFARVPTWLRGRLIGVFGPNIDYVVRTRIKDPAKVKSWVMDQYFHPSEFWHSIDDVLGWFEGAGVEYLNCSPGILGTDSDGAQDLFAKSNPGNKYLRIVSQLAWIRMIGQEGALFDVIGRAPS